MLVVDGRYWDEREPTSIRLDGRIEQNKRSMALEAAGKPEQPVVRIDEKCKVRGLEKQQNTVIFEVSLIMGASMMAKGINRSQLGNGHRREAISLC
jgi:hypothetical protein